jgi:Glycosyltransferase family 87
MQKSIKLKTFFHKNKAEFKEIFNEFDFSIPKRENVYKRCFPDKMIFVFILCILVKLAFFFYGIYFHENGLSPTRDAFFVQYAEFWWDAEGLSDFAGDYYLFRANFLNGEPLYTDAFNGRYLYPPLFYYVINVFAWWTKYSAPIVMMICNIMMGYMIFHLAKNWGASGKAAKRMMLLSLLSPINLFYSDFIWQNAIVFTSFVVWAMLKISKEQYKWGMVIMGIAIGIKQVAVFFLPAMLFGIVYKLYLKDKKLWKHKYTLVEYIKSIPWNALIYYALIPIEVFLISSLPYIITIPDTYLYYLTGGYGGANPSWIELIFSNIVPVSAEGHFVGYFPDLSFGDPNNHYQVNYRAVLDVAFSWIGHVYGIPLSVTVTFAILFHYQVFLYASVALLFLIYWRLVKNQRYETDREYYWIMWQAASIMYFSCILWVEKGIYKYYLVSLTPFWAIYGNFTPLNHEGWKKSSKLKNQLNGGGSLFHMVETIGLQLLMIYSNKWLMPLFLLLPLYLINCMQLFLQSGKKRNKTK